MAATVTCAGATACTQLDTRESGGANCDEPDEGSAFRLFTHGASITQGDEQFEGVYGVVAAEVARLEAQHADGSLHLLDLIPMDAAGRGGGAASVRTLLSRRGTLRDHLAVRR